MDIVEEIKSRLSIEEVVGPYVQMKKSGRNFKACCPFHSEKTPSFIISPDKGMAYCFGCRKGGDLFAFTQEVEGVDFTESIRILAEKAGIEYKREQHSGLKKEDKDRLSNIMDTALEFFQQGLENYKPGQEYLAKRDYDRNTQKRLLLGYAPEGFHHLTEYLKAKGFQQQDMLSAGLVSQKEVGDNKVYDRFRHRIMFPIHNPQGKLVAFGGRTLSKDSDAAKYLNSPETEYYHKGKTLYCYHRAKKAIREQDQAIIVEGYFDALSAQLHGFPQTVASLGTALTEQQIKLIGRLTKNLYFAFDNDTSGQTAASRSIEIAQTLGYNTHIIMIPSGKDPDEALRKAPEEWKEAIAKAMSATDYELSKALQIHDFRNIEGKKAILKHMLPVIQRLPNQLEKEQELKKLSLELETSLKSLFIELQKTKVSSPLSASSDSDSEGEIIPDTSYTPAESLLGLMTMNSSKNSDSFGLISANWYRSEREKKLYNTLAAQYNQAETVSEKETADNGDPHHLHLLELFAEDRYEHFSEEELHEETTKLICSLRQQHRKNRLQELKFQMAKDPQNADLVQEFQELLQELNTDNNNNPEPT